MTDSILKIESLVKHFPLKEGFFSRPTAWVKAVDNVSFSMKEGDVLGIVGESGCGKTTLVNTVLNLYEPTSGRVIFNGNNIYGLNKEALRKTRKDIQIVFQDPFWSLNPRMLVLNIIAEPIRAHGGAKGDELLKRVEELMESVGLLKTDVYKYPHEFSGGQRQRIAIARALALNPKLIVLDEPTSSIDLLSQMQILELLTNIKEKMDLTYILISHDLSVVNTLANKIAVMYLGKIVEYGPSMDIFHKPLHPYTQALFGAIPDINKRIGDLDILEGDVPSAINPPDGCRFHTRCKRVMDLCKTLEPLTVDLGNDRCVACHLFDS